MLGRLARLIAFLTRSIDAATHGNLHMTAADPDWPFDDPPNVAVFTIHQIIRGEHIVDYVAHDDDDGAWQFLNRAVDFKMADAMLVGLSEMVKFDSSLRELWDLPYGWCAWREGKGQPWHRARKEPEEE
ncbi:hypothetical protein [Mesorhizobium australafricanum]|uniref:Uncharacterized protein n=1 Tax=Mesorhizobium australafricanum TaxID=3072311 RepID=A0ABU4X8N1_9HYPH|nr:hypothetical protein [Mesorhizobium sp. VK3E]MDX8443424.1 hypothetical protein [Mesorhizobium sp. VK3E]